MALLNVAAAAVGSVVPLAARRPAPATMNRRFAGVRSLCEYVTYSGFRCRPRNRARLSQML